MLEERSEKPALLLLLFVLLVSGTLRSQATPPPSTGNAPPSATQEDSDDPKFLLRHLAQDQAAIWTSPFHMRARDLKWGIPFAGITAGLIMTDRSASHELSRGTQASTSKTFSDFGLFAAAGSSAGMYLLGRYTGDRQLRETGLLGGEAMANALAVDEVLKLVFQRERPAEGNGAGRFFQSGSQRSFPSGHATISFALATVVAHEYPGWLVQTLAYGGASAISFARVTGKQHFPSDVFVGATTGYLIGRHVYRARHDGELDGANFGTFEAGPSYVTLSEAGSSYVALDSWIYPAVERLVALGVVKRPFLGLRPWTRASIADMLAASDVPDDGALAEEPAALFSALRAEFSRELGFVEDQAANQSIRLESLYARVAPISGTPLNDSYHFGQTVINDFGRPYQSGFNAISGFTARAEHGRFFFYARGEYQHAPGAAAYPASVRAVISNADVTPLQPPNPVPEANQFRLLDTYTGFTLLGHSISVGKQTLWWGVGEGGAMIFSDNVEPMYMLRINRVMPLRVPLLSRLLGPLRYDNFFGRLSGHQFPPHPYMYGNKISFQPTENFEFGFSRTGIFAGQGKTPLTFGTFWNSFTSTSDVPGTLKGTPRDPGARHGAFDFSYRVPFLRNWLTIYSDSVVHDDISPVDAPRRAAIVPGLYISHFPGLRKLDFRAESGYTDIDPIGNDQEGRFLYWENIYRDAYTNKGNLLGSWMGRQGKGTQLWSHYWLNANSTVELGYRNARVSPEFIPGGVSLNDLAAGARLRLRPTLELQGKLQYEWWKAPVLASDRRSNFLTSIQLTFYPRDWVKTRD